MTLGSLCWAGRAVVALLTLIIEAADGQMSRGDLTWVAPGRSQNDPIGAV